MVKNTGETDVAERSLEKGFRIEELEVIEGRVSNVVEILLRRSPSMWIWT